jgi:hypothetical protein
MEKIMPERDDKGSESDDAYYTKLTMENLMLIEQNGYLTIALASLVIGVVLIVVTLVAKIMIHGTR